MEHRASSLRWLLFTCILLVAGLLIPELLAPFVRSYIQDRAAKTLRERFDGDVTFGDIRVSVFPRITLSGTDLVLRKRGRPGVPPLIQIKKFAAHAGFLPLLRGTSHIKLVRIEGLQIHIPPHADREPGNPSTPKKEKAYPVVIDELVADGTELLILPKETGKDPRHFQIHQLTMRSVGLDRPAPFEASLTNARPPGEIRTHGQFGPWSREDPGQTPVAAAYTFEHADLGVFRGIGGVLSSQGQFGGLLENLFVQGETSTPDFRVRSGNHPVSLQTQFQAIVDGTNGNTLLIPVRARFLHSSFTANGGVIRVSRGAGVKGCTVFLDVKAKEARIEDLLQLVIKTDRPAMTGPIRFESRFELPPGEAEVFDRLKLEGEFGIGGGRFTSLDLRQKLKGLSRRAQGDPEDESAGSSVSNLAGRFTMANGVVNFSNLRFSVPGAAVALNGSYAFRSEALDFRGELRLDAKLSETTTGVKSWLLKAVDPLFKRKRAGAVVPIRIQGTRSAPSFGLDVGRVIGRK